MRRLLYFSTLLLTLVRLSSAEGNHIKPDMFRLLINPTMLTVVSVLKDNVTLLLTLQPKSRNMRQSFLTHIAVGL